MQQDKYVLNGHSILIIEDGGQSFVGYDALKAALGISECVYDHSSVLGTATTDEGEVEVIADRQLLSMLASIIASAEFDITSPVCQKIVDAVKSIYDLGFDHFSVLPGADTSNVSFDVMQLQNQLKEAEPRLRAAKALVNSLTARATELDELIDPETIAELRRQASEARQASIVAYNNYSDPALSPEEKKPFADEMHAQQDKANALNAQISELESKSHPANAERVGVTNQLRDANAELAAAQADYDRITTLLSEQAPPSTAALNILTNVLGPSAPAPADSPAQEEPNPQGYGTTATE